VNHLSWEDRREALKREVDCGAALVLSDCVAMMCGRYSYDIDVPIVQGIIESYGFVVTNRSEVPRPEVDGEFKIWPLFYIRFRRPHE
jgi:hypothetical protein